MISERESERIRKGLNKIDELVKIEINNDKKYMSNLNKEIENVINKVSNVKNDSERINELEIFLMKLEKPETLVEVKKRHDIAYKTIELYENKIIEKYTYSYKWLRSELHKNDIISQSTKEDLILQILTNYLIRNGRYDIITQMKQENLTKMNEIVVNFEKKDIFLKLYKIVENLRQSDLVLFDEWISNSENFVNFKTFFEFKLKFRNLEFLRGKLKFLILAKQQPEEAFSFAREYFTRFKQDKMLKEQIQNLMGFIVFQKSSERKEKEEISKEIEICLNLLKISFVEVFCEVNNIAMKSYLETTLKAAIEVLPSLSKGMKVATMKKDFKKSHVELERPRNLRLRRSSSDSFSSYLSEETIPFVEMDKVVEIEPIVSEERALNWRELDELPDTGMTTSLGSFHSVFVCPITREESKPNNPPIMLACGHVIALESLNRAQFSNGSIKCPTCPHEQDRDTVTRLYF